MIYKMPKGQKYTDLCIYIDSEIKKPDCDEEKCFEYMYHLFYILAVKGRMFITASDYDNYALYGATQLFLRYKKEKEPGSKLKPIKSCLNYIKRILYPLKVNYQKANFFQVFKEESLEGNAPVGITDTQRATANSINNNLMQTEYKYCLSQITSTIKLILKDSPYSNNKVIIHNLYISCLLTILKTITISEENLKRLKLREVKKSINDNFINKIYEEESKDDVVIYHLDSTMGNYIDTLVKRCKKSIAKDLSYIIDSYKLSDDIITEMLMQPLEDYSDGQN